MMLVVLLQRLALSFLLVWFFFAADAAPARTSSSPTKPVSARIREDLGRLVGVRGTATYCAPA